MPYRSYKPALRRHQRAEVQPHLQVDPQFEAARRVACDLVARRWPALACVQPIAGSRHRRQPDAALLRRLNLDVPVAPSSAEREFTFTFARPADDGEGPPAPRVARVTVDDQQRVVKALVSK